MVDLPKPPKSLQGIDPARAGTFLPREGTRRSYKAQGLGRLMPKLTRQIAGKRPTLISDLQGEWSPIVGHDLAQFCRPIKLQAQVLHLEIAMGVGPALALHQDTILSRVNMHLGAGKVRRLSLHQVDFPLPQMNPSQDSVRATAEPLTPQETQPNGASNVGSALENLRARLEKRASQAKSPPEHDGQTKEIDL